MTSVLRQAVEALEHAPIYDYGTEYHRTWYDVHRVAALSALRAEIDRQARLGEGLETTAGWTVERVKESLSYNSDTGSREAVELIDRLLAKIAR